MFSNDVRVTAECALPGAEPAPRSSRRALLLGIAGVAGTTAAVGVPAAKAEAATDPVLHLLRRATYGPTPQLMAEVRSQGISAWLDAQLAPTGISDPVVENLSSRWVGQTWKTWEVREKVASSARWDFLLGTVERQIARAIWSKRQLFEVMVNLWTNHLVVPVPNSEVYDSAHLYQRNVIQKYALGRYASLLSEAVRHPALLQILDNASSTKQAPNENHARELLELHTVGRGRYSEADVKQAALVLTGLSIDKESGLFEFKPWRHHVGPVKVLGWSSQNATAEGGLTVANSLLEYLAHHPDTARLIATKLAVHFVSDSPPSSLVDKLASLYLSSDTAIAPVLKKLFTSAEFAASTGQKTRTPYEDGIATARILGLQPASSGTEGLRDLVWILSGMGEVPMGWSAPNGYPDVASAWAGAGSTLRRWNFHLGVLNGSYARTLPRPTVDALLPAKLPANYGDLLDALAARLLVIPLTSAQRTAICQFLLHSPGDALKAQDAAVTFRLTYVAALILDAPNFSTR